MNDLNHDDPAAIIAHTASRLPLPASVQKAAETAGRAAYNAAIGSGSSTARRFALQKALKATRDFGREAVRKSESDALAGIVSTDFDIGPATSNQAASQETRTTQVQALAALAGRKLQTFGGDANDPEDVAHAINLVIEDYSGGRNETLDQMDAKRAAELRESGDIAWPSDLSDPRATADADALNGELGTPTNFSGRRNDPRAVYSAAGPETGFSTSRAPSVPAGAADGATISNASIKAIAQAAATAAIQAFTAGRSAGDLSSPQSSATPSTNFAKAQRQRALSAARRGR